MDFRENSMMDGYDTLPDSDDGLCRKDTVVKVGSIVVPLFFSIVVLFSLFGNILVLVILVLCENLKSLTNIFILSLAVSDLLFTVGLPFWACYYIWGWTLGDAACKTVCFVFYAGFYSSVMFLMMMTFQRYLAVVYPHSDWEKRQGISLIPILGWVVSIGAALPAPIYSSVIANPKDDSQLYYNNTELFDITYIYTDIDEILNQLCYKDSVAKVGSIVVPLFFSIVVLLSLIGNILVLVTLAYYKNLKSLTNIFILNLAVSDLLFTVGLPFWACYYIWGWTLGDVACKTVCFVFYAGTLRNDAVAKVGSIVVPLFFSIVVLLSLIGNILVLVTLAYYENLKSLTNIFILNLAVSDLIFTVGLPFWACYYIWGWTLGDAACKTVCFVFYAGFYSSVMFLMMMTFQRYLAVVYPHSDWEKRQGISLIPILGWVVSIGAALPAPIYSSVIANPKDDSQLYYNNTELFDITYIYTDIDEILNQLCYKDSVAKVGSIVVPLFFSIVVLLSLIGNILVLVTLAYYKNLKSLTNIFILNLAVSDLLFTVGLPFWACYYIWGWTLGDVACKTVCFVFYAGTLRNDAVAKVGSIVVPLFFSIVVLLSLIGNILVLVTLAYYENLKSLTNIFILNLAVSDLIFTVGLPFWACYYIWGWTLGDAACKTVCFVFYAGFYSSVMFLMMMTFQRYLAVVYPHSDWEKRQGISLIPILGWVVSIGAALPAPIYSSVIANPKDDSQLYYNNTELFDITYIYTDIDEILNQLCYKDSVAKVGSIVVPLFFSIVVLLSLIGNILVLVTLAYYKNLKSLTNIFILNLAVSDLLFTVGLPFWACYYIWGWTLGDVACKTVCFVFYAGTLRNV
ncbi:hypothetical protein KOW79_013092 [Hemibagrus wyckioides]|uniref:G-protein coupled receptors family 1 profile domain-containing protein n=1 Tax=Hemibagrus wyckioides TaxID=337641 RepID=A0A9D3SGV8_9TELE|nr:hypothetical protein KOW79_013092 [Hemibagrus wyckioides]